MENIEYKEYKEFEGEISDVLESNFQTAMFNGELEDAYDALGKLMAYKLIEKNDGRIEKKNKSYLKAGISADHRFALDYRKSTDFIPKWLFGDIDYSKNCKAISIEHWGKRVEGNFEGDTMFDSREFEIRLSCCNTEKAVENAFEEIESIMKEGTNRPFNKNTLQDLCKAGVYRLIRIDVESNCIQSNKKLGHAIIKMSKDGVEAVVIPKYSSMIGNWLPIKSTMGILDATLVDMIGEGVKVIHAFKPDKAIEIQQAKVNKSNDMTVLMAKKNKNNEEE